MASRFPPEMLLTGEFRRPTVINILLLSLLAPEGVDSSVVVLFRFHFDKYSRVVRCESQSRREQHQDAPSVPFQFLPTA